jgi:hypothetical protein
MNMRLSRATILILLSLPTLAQDFTQWRHYAPLHLNTSDTGAAVKSDVHNFPIPVTLTRDNFNFTQPKPDGSDLRFSSAQNANPLPHHIEHWDPKNQSALIWVKVPTVKGNASDQTVFMHWGSPNAASSADSTAVFDTKEGWVGVWHLDEDSSTDPDHYKDATANAAHATGVNLTKPGSRVDARTGKGLLLKHAQNQWLKVAGEKRKLFDHTSKLTFSIWAKADSYANKGDPATRALPGYETMFAKGDNSWRLQKFGIKSWHKPPADLIEICVEKAPRGDLCVVGKTDMTTGKWFHFVGVHDHPKARIYVNGALDQEETFPDPWSSGDHPVGIGNQSQFPEKGRSWDGTLDEARVLSVVKDENWIKVDYESQREGQKFITVGAPRAR